MTNVNPPSKMILRFAKGEYLFKQGEMSKDLYIIKSGLVQIFKTEGGVDVILDKVGPGMVVGEVASIDDGPRSASGVTLEETEAVVISSEDFKGILERIPDWFRKIALILVQRLREVDEKIAKSIDGDRSSQIAAFLQLIFASEYCSLSPEGLYVNLKFLENECMDLFNMQVGEISTILGQFEKKEIIKIDKNKIYLINDRFLSNLAQEIYISKSELPAT